MTSASRPDTGREVGKRSATTGDTNGVRELFEIHLGRCTVPPLNSFLVFNLLNGESLQEWVLLIAGMD